AVARRGGELRVELRGEEPRVLRQLDHFHQAIARETREAQPRRPIALQVAVVELVAMAVALEDHLASVQLAGPRPRREQHFLGAEAHGAALAGSLVAALR